MSIKTRINKYNNSRWNNNLIINKLLCLYKTVIVILIIKNMIILLNFFNLRIGVKIIKIKLILWIQVIIVMLAIWVIINFKEMVVVII